MMKELLRRRVPQFLGGYLVAVWGVVQFVSFLEERYSLPNGLVEMVGAGLLLLLPSVVVVAWGHGTPGPDVWTRRERFLVPFNLVIAVGIAVFLTRGGDALGTVTETIQIQNEEGVVEERVVPAASLRTRITPFFLTNETGDPSLDWIGSTVPTLMSISFLQDLSVTVSNPYLTLSRFNEAGHPSGMGAPRALQRRIAEQYQSPHYLMGSYRRDGDDYILEQELVEGATHRTIGTMEARGPALLPLIDQLVEQVRVDLELPEAYRENTVMLPLAETFTDSPEAVELFGQSQLDLVLHNDYAGALDKLQRATELDPGFCVGHFQVFVVALSAGRAELVEPAIERAMETIYRVPEGIQFTVKLNYFYQAKQDGEKALAVGRMWTKLYPDDQDAHGVMVTLLNLAEDYEGAIASVEKLRELDPTRDDYLTLASQLYRKMGDYDAALASLREFADRNPEDHRSFTQLADLMAEFGHLEQARQELETAALLAPAELDVLLEQIRLTQKLGDREAVESLLADATREAETPASRARVEGVLQDVRERQGRIREALEHRAAHFEALRSSASPIQVSIQSMLDFSTYREAGRLEEFRLEQEELAQGLQGSLAPYAALGRGLLASELGDLETAEAALPMIQALVEQQKLEVARRPWRVTLANLAEHRGDPDEAIRLYTRLLEPTSVNTRRELARLYREQGNLRQARTLLEEALRLDPSHPRVHLEMARVARDEGRAAEGLEHVERTLEIWSDADDDYFRLREARALREDLERSL